MNIGILGGSFDPVHNGHILLAKKAFRQLKLNVLFFLPAYLPPHKKRKLTSASDRKWMLEIAISGNKNFLISDHELNIKSKRYTYQTLRYFKKKYAGSRLFFIIGSDSAASFSRWKCPEEIKTHAKIAVGTRTGHNFNRGLIPFIFLPGQIADISSTGIRLRVKHGLPIKKLVPAAVEGYIRKHGLYR